MRQTNRLPFKLDGNALAKARLFFACCAMVLSLAGSAIFLTGCSSAEQKSDSVQESGVSWEDGGNAYLQETYDAEFPYLDEVTKPELTNLVIVLMKHEWRFVRIQESGRGSEWASTAKLFEYQNRFAEEAILLAEIIDIDGNDKAALEEAYGRLHQIIGADPDGASKGKGRVK